MLPQLPKKCRVGKVDITDVGLLVEITKAIVNVGDLNHAET